MRWPLNLSECPNHGCTASLSGAAVAAFAPAAIASPDEGLDLLLMGPLTQCSWVTCRVGPIVAATTITTMGGSLNLLLQLGLQLCPTKLQLLDTCRVGPIALVTGRLNEPRRLRCWCWCCSATRGSLAHEIGITPHQKLQQGGRGAHCLLGFVAGRSRRTSVPLEAFRGD